MGSGAWVGAGGRKPWWEGTVSRRLHTFFSIYGSLGMPVSVKFKRNFGHGAVRGQTVLRKED